MNQPISMKILKKIITLEFIDDIFNRTGNILAIPSHKVDMFLYNRDIVFLWSPPDLIQEYELAFADSLDDGRDKAHRRFLDILVRSYEPDDVHLGVAILQDYLLRAHTFKQKRKALRLLAIGYYRIGNLSKSLDYISRCLEIKPLWVEAMIVKGLVEHCINKERRRNLLMDSAMAIGLVTGLLGYSTLLLDPTWVIEALRMELLAKKGVKKVVTGSLRDICTPLPMHEEMYLLAHRYFIRGYFEDMPRCNYLIDRCLEIAPGWKPAMTLKRRMKYASMKAYFGELILPYAVGGIFAVSVIRWAGI